MEYNINLDEKNIFNNVNDFNEILLNEIKNDKINKTDAIKYKKIYDYILKFDTVKDMIEVEDAYYIKYDCLTEYQRIILEVQYLKIKLIHLFKESKDLSRRKNEIASAIIMLDKAQKSINENLSEDEFRDNKNFLIMLEAEFDIEIKFIYNAYELLKRAVYLKEDEKDEDRVIGKKI